MMHFGVIGGQVDFTNPNISTLGGYIESGDVKPLAVFSNERMDAYRISRHSQRQFRKLRST